MNVVVVASVVTRPVVVGLFASVDISVSFSSGEVLVVIFMVVANVLVVFELNVVVSSSGVIVVVTDIVVISVVLLVNIEVVGSVLVADAVVVGLKDVLLVVVIFSVVDSVSVPTVFVVCSAEVVDPAIGVSVDLVVRLFRSSVEVLVVILVAIANVDIVVESDVVVVPVDPELVDECAPVIVEVSPLFEGNWITVEVLLFFPLYTRLTMSTPIAVVITPAKRQARKIFHRDQSLEMFRATWKGCN